MKYQHKFHIQMTKGACSWQVQLQGDFLKENLPQFNDLIYEKFRDEGLDHLLLDMRSLSFLSSSAMGALVRLHHFLQKGHKKLILVALPPTIAEVLKITKLDSFFYSSPSPEQAVAMFAEQEPDH